MKNVKRRSASKSNNYDMGGADLSAPARATRDSGINAAATCAGALIDTRRRCKTDNDLQIPRICKLPIYIFYLYYFYIFYNIKVINKYINI
jgi:hypothetical protein